MTRSSDQSFTQTLLRWHRENPRQLLFTGSKDPYRVWISEIIFQQTRIEQGTPYFLRFIDRFPDVHSLASAAEDEVLRYWQGLGYNTRARNLHAAAQEVVASYDGVFPGRYEDILALPGIGSYTAAAIASFAFGLPYPVIDANVIRVASRYWGIDKPPQSKGMKSQILELLEKAMSDSDPAEFNQAIMNFGAVVCRPRNPECTKCPFAPNCYAFINERVGELPRKKHRSGKRKRYFHYLVFDKGEEILIRKRAEGDIWARLYDFPLLESKEDDAISEEDLHKEVSRLTRGSSGTLVDVFRYRQELSHQSITANFYEISTKEGVSEPLPEDYYLVNRKNLDNFAFPKLVNCYLQDKSIFLE